MVIIMNSPTHISEQRISFLAKDFINNKAFSVFGKNKSSKLYNLFSIALGGEHGYGNLKASCKFRPYVFIPEKPNLFEIARRGANDDKRLYSSVPLAHLYYDLTFDITVVANLVREYMLCQFISHAYQAIKKSTHDQYDIINAWCDHDKGFKPEYMEVFAINTMWATIPTDGLCLGEILNYSLLDSDFDKDIMMSFVKKTEDSWPNKYTEEVKRTLNSFFANVKFSNLANILLLFFTKFISKNINFDVKAFVINNIDYDNFIGMRCLNDNGHIEIEYKLFSNFIIMRSSTMCRMVDINEVQHGTLKQIFRNTRISDKDKAKRVGDIYLVCLLKNKDKKSELEDWKYSIEQYKSKYLN